MIENLEEKINQESSEINLPPTLLPDETSINVHKKNGQISYIIIDKDKEEMLNKYCWYIDDDGYAHTSYTQNKKRYHLKMHKLLLKGKIIDHIDCNRLNNTMKNLRVSTIKLNALNRSRNNNVKTKYRGVAFCKNVKKFRVNIRRKCVGYWDDEISAAYGYNEYILNNFQDDEFLMKNLNEVEKPKDYKAPKKPKTKYQPDLPKGVVFVKKTKSYRLKITFKNEKSPQIYIKDKKEALQKYEEILEKLKQTWNAKMNELTITRNIDGIAVIRTTKWSKNMSDEEKVHQEILVDDDEWHKLMKIGFWNIDEGYAKNRSTRMHRLIMNCDDNDTDYHIDHIDYNKKDNRKTNLRKLHKDDPLHGHNRKLKQSHNSSKYRGVSFRKDAQRWWMNICHQGVRICKLFDSEEEAARYYDQQATNLYGVNANLNFPNESKVLKKRVREECTSDTIENASKRSRLTQK